MKEVLSIAVFALGALCFVALVTTVRPTAVSVIQVAPDYCQRHPSGMRGCDLHGFAAMSGAVKPPRLAMLVKAGRNTSGPAQMVVPGNEKGGSGRSPSP